MNTGSLASYSNSLAYILGAFTILNNCAVVSDWGGTLYPRITVLNWSRFLKERGLFTKDALSELENLFQQYATRKISHDDLGEVTAPIYAAGLAGQKIQLIAEAARDFVSLEQAAIYSFVSTVFTRLDKLGMKIILISGSPKIVLQEFCQHLPISYLYGLEVEKDNVGIFFLGHVQDNPGVSARKAEIVQLVSQNHEICFAFGNSFSDLPLLNAATYPIVINTEIERFPKSAQDRRFLFLNIEQVEASLSAILSRIGDERGSSHTS